MNDNTNQRIQVLLNLIGLLLSAVLTYIHVRVHMDPTYESICAVGATLNCETVATSVFSTFFGIPLAVLGGLFYLFMGTTALMSLIRKKTAIPGIRATAALFAAGVSIGLFILSSTIIRAFCLLCMATYIVNIALFLVALSSVRSSGGVFNRLKTELALLRRKPWGIAAVGAGLALLLAAGPFRGFPRYWEMASWQSGTVLDHGFTPSELPWIGAESPTLTIDEYFDFECPSCRNAHKNLRRRLARHRDTVRVVRHDMPRVSCSTPTGHSRHRCLTAKAAYCAGLENRYWDWNDAVIAHPKPVTGPSRETFELDLAKTLGFDTTAFARCLDDDKTKEHVIRVQEDGKRKKVTFTPTYFIGDQKVVGLKKMLDAAAKHL